MQLLNKDEDQNVRELDLQPINCRNSKMMCNIHNSLKHSGQHIILWYVITLKKINQRFAFPDVPYLGCTLVLYGVSRSLLTHSLTIPRWMSTVPLVQVSVIRYGPVRGADSLEISPGYSNWTISPTRFSYSILFKSSFLLLSLMMSCLHCLILAQSVLNWIGNNTPCPKTNCPGVASNVVWMVLHIDHSATLRKGPQGSFASSSLFSSSNVLAHCLMLYVLVLKYRLIADCNKRTVFPSSLNCRTFV
jgi:hypothetical protein